MPLSTTAPKKSNSGYNPEQAAKNDKPYEMKDMSGRSAEPGDSASTAGVGRSTATPVAPMPSTNIGGPRAATASRLQQTTPLTQPSSSQRTPKVASMTYTAGPFADRTMFGDGAKMLDGPKVNLRWNEDITRLPRQEAEAPTYPPKVSTEPPDPNKFTPTASVPRYPSAAQDTIKRNCGLYARQALDPDTADASIPPFSLMVREKLSGGTGALLNTFRSDEVRESRRNKYADNLNRDMGTKADFEQRVQILFGLTPNGFGKSRLAAELEELRKGPIPFARPLLAAEISASVFDGDANKAATALRTIRLGGLRLADLADAGTREGGSADEKGAAFDLAKALASAKGEGIEVLKTSMRKHDITNNTPEAIKDFMILIGGLQTLQTFKPGRAKSFETPQGIVMVPLALSNEPCPLEIDFQQKTTPQDKIDYAIGVHGAFLNAAQNKASDADLVKIFSWNGGIRTQKQEQSRREEVQSMAVGWMMKSGKKTARSNADYIPLATAFEALDAGVRVTINSKKAADNVPSPFAMLRDEGISGINVDWVSKEQKKYNIKMEGACRDAIKALRPVLDGFAEVKKPKLVEAKWFEARFNDILDRGRNDAPVVEDAASTDKLKKPVRASTLRAEGGTRVMTGLDVEESKPRLDRVPFEEDHARDIREEVVNDIKKRSPGLSGFVRSGEGQRLMDELAELDLIETLDRAVEMMSRENNLSSVPVYSTTDLDAFKAGLKEAKSIRASEPLKAKSSAFADVFDTLEAGMDGAYLGNRQYFRDGHQIGVNRASPSVASGFTVLAGGPIATANAAIEGQLVILSGGAGQEIGCHVNTRYTLGLGGNIAANFLKYTGVTDHMSAVVNGRAEVTMTFEQARGFGFRANRELDSKGNAFKRFRAEDTDHPGVRYNPNVHGKIDDSRLQDEYKFNTVNKILNPWKQYCTDLAEAGELDQTLYDRFAIANALDEGMAIVGEIQNASTQDISAAVGISVSAKTPGKDQAAFGISASGGVGSRSSSINRSDPSDSSSRRGVVQADTTNRVTGAFNFNIGVPAVPVDHNRNVAAVGLNAMAFGGSGFADTSGVGVSPRNFEKRGVSDVYNSTLDVPLRTLDEKREAIEQDRAGWEGMMGKQNLDAGLAESKVEESVDTFYALRYHNTPEFNQTENVYKALANHRRANAKSEQSQASATKDIESLVSGLSAAKANPNNAVAQGDFDLEVKLTQSRVGLNYMAQAERVRTVYVEHEKAYNGNSNANSVGAAKVRSQIPTEDEDGGEVPTSSTTAETQQAIGIPAGIEGEIDL